MNAALRLSIACLLTLDCGAAAADIAVKHGMPGVNLLPTQIRRKPR